jgi:putative transposase
VRKIGHWSHFTLLSMSIDGRVKVRENQRVINKAIYLADGAWICKDKRSYWGCGCPKTRGRNSGSRSSTPLSNRGLKDIFIACVDGLTGLPEAIETVYPPTRVQLCMVHMVRNSLKYVSYKHRKDVAADLKLIYGAATEAEAEVYLDLTAREVEPTVSQYQQIVANTLGPCHPAFRLSRGHPASVISTTNATPSVNMT